jgi:hypothetical protein
VKKNVEPFPGSDSPQIRPYVLLDDSLADDVIYLSAREFVTGMRPMTDAEGALEKLRFNTDPIVLDRKAPIPILSLTLM